MAADESGGQESDSVFEEYQAHCMAKPEVVEEYPWGEVVWKVRGKVFAIAGRGSRRVTVKSTLEKQSALVQHPHIEAAAYVGRYGWVTIDSRDDATLEIARDLIDESYEAVGRRTRQKADSSLKKRG